MDSLRALLHDFEPDLVKLVWPGHLLGLAKIWQHVTLSELTANIASQLAVDSPLTVLDRFPSSIEEQNVNRELHGRCKQYGFATSTDLPDGMQKKLAEFAAPVSALLAPWKQVCMNFWVGASSGSLHYDERDNVLMQLRGTKRVVMFPIEHTAACRLHAMLARLPNHSQYASKFFTQEALAGNPALAAAPYFEVELRAGDSLVIPAGVMHAPIGSLDSVSLNLFVNDGPPPAKRSWCVCNGWCLREDLA